jgi:hypothetical protein
MTTGPWPRMERLDAIRSGPLAVADTLRHTGYPTPATELAVEFESTRRSVPKPERCVTAMRSGEHDPRGGRLIGYAGGR